MLWITRGQLWLLLASCLFGLGMGVVYTLCRGLRGRWDWPGDLAFCLVAGTGALVYFQAVCALQLRLYMGVGVAVGFGLWRWGPERLLLGLGQKAKKRKQP